MNVSDDLLLFLIIVLVCVGVWLIVFGGRDGV